MAVAKLCKAGREHYNLLQAMKYQWENPPAGFNSQYDPIKAEKHKRIEKLVKAGLDAYHSTLKRVGMDEYYDLMDVREKELRLLYSGV
jgi:hypothetical protein